MAAKMKLTGPRSRAEVEAWLTTFWNDGRTPELRAEMERRKSKPNPAARPCASTSAALTVLERNLAAAAEPELRARLQQAIDNLRARYRPDGPITREASPQARRSDYFKWARPGTVKAYIAELLSETAAIRDGHPIGHDYSTIIAKVRKRFPVITTGVHAGKATRCNLAELTEIARECRERGLTLPHRPRSPRSKRRSRCSSSCEYSNGRLKSSS